MSASYRHQHLANECEGRLKTQAWNSVKGDFHSKRGMIVWKSLKYNLKQSSIPTMPAMYIFYYSYGITEHVVPV